MPLDNSTGAARVSEIKHPTYGTLDELLAAIGSDVRNGYYMRIGQQGALAWFSDQYSLARHQAEAQEPPA